MKRALWLCLISVLPLLIPTVAFSQTWSGILDPTRAINWSGAGVPGGIPSASWTQSGSTVAASACGNGASDCTSTIQAALNSCGTNHYVLLGAGTFLLNGGLRMPSNCVLRGSGADQTILNAKSTNSFDIAFGSTSGPNWSNSISITGGNSQGSKSITVSSASGISVGSYLVIDQLNDGTIVSVAGSEGSCTWCDGGQTSNGSRAQGQIVRVISVNGTTVGIDPGLFVAYTRSPTATPFSMAVTNSGVEDLQIYANNTHSSNNSNIEMGSCANCWVSGIESNYTDGDHIDLDWSYHSEIVDSYFSGTYGTGPGTFDHGIRIARKTTLCLIQNNIMERTGVLEPEWGAAGNVFAYNFMTGAHYTSAPNFMVANIEMHGAHPQFNLFEGNVVNKINWDSIWGSSADNTNFRNWIRGASKVCNSMSGGRDAVICSPMGVQGATGVNGWWAIQAVRAVDINFLSTYNNFVGDVVGSSDMANLTQYNGGTPMNMVALASVPSSRNYDSSAYGFNFGYGEASDTGSSGFDSATPYSTAFLHGVYNNVDGSTTWANGITHTLPSSFYLGAKPSWWPSNIPWPAIGPDITGGAGPGGHAYSLTASNAAQYCYTAVLGGSEGGAGSPLPFNRARCYGASASSSMPLPPTGLTAIVN